MSLKAFAAKIFANRVAKRTKKWVTNPVRAQERVFRELITTAQSTEFGKDHNFANIHSHEDFVQSVPIRDYEELKDYVGKIFAGADDVLWPGKPLYFAKTSGTTSGAKYIPITKPSIKAQVEASRNAILNYIHETGNADFVDGKMIFLQGSPELEEKSGIAAHLMGIQ